MITEVIEPNILVKLGEKIGSAWGEFKALLMKIFSFICNDKKEDLKEEFSNKYVSFACELRNEGYVNEALFYMRICDMIRNAIPRTEVLKAHQEFFNKLFSVFNELLSFSVNNCDNYEEKHWECLKFLVDCESYFYTKVAVHSPKYDKAVCDEILSHLCGAFL